MDTTPAAARRHAGLPRVPRLPALLALLLTAAAGPATAQAASRPVDCSLVVKGRSYLQGVCEFRPLGTDGSFSLHGDAYFAYVNLTGKGVAEGSWNADPRSTHAQAPLGELRRQGACWENAQARVCARDLSAAQRQAVIAARPKGQLLVPEYGGLSQSCVGVEGGTWRAGARLVLHLGNDCRLTRDAAFVSVAGSLRTATAPAWCLGAAAPGAPVVLADCGPSAGRWTHPGGLDPSPVKADGLCLAVTQLHNDRFKGSLPLVAQPCGQSQKTAEVLPFFLSRD